MLELKLAHDIIHRKAEECFILMLFEMKGIVRILQSKGNQLKNLKMETTPSDFYCFLKRMPKKNKHKARQSVF